MLNLPLAIKPVNTTRIKTPIAICILGSELGLTSATHSRSRGAIRMRGHLLGTLAILSLFGSGCDGLRPEANPEAPVWKNRAGWALNLHYSKTLLAPSRASGEPYEKAEPEIDVLGRRVFVGSSDGGLYALNASQGEVLWRFQTLIRVSSRFRARRHRRSCTRPAVAGSTTA